MNEMLDCLAIGLQPAPLETGSGWLAVIGIMNVARLNLFQHTETAVFVSDTKISDTLFILPTAQGFEPFLLNCLIHE